MPGKRNFRFVTPRLLREIMVNLQMNYKKLVAYNQKNIFYLMFLCFMPLISKKLNK